MGATTTEHTMKYADTRETTSPFELANLSPKSRISFRDTVKRRVTSLLAPRVDPSRLTRIERREMGVAEHEVDWHNALHGPLIK